MATLRESGNSSACCPLRGPDLAWNDGRARPQMRALYPVASVWIAWNTWCGPRVWTPMMYGVRTIFPTGSPIALARGSQPHDNVVVIAAGRDDSGARVLDLSNTEIETQSARTSWRCPALPRQSAGS